MGVAEKLRELRWRAAGHYTRLLPAELGEPLRGARGLEIGGPSAVFGASGLLAVYPLLAAIDGVQWSADTAWHHLDRAQGYCPDGVRRGELHIVDDVALAAFPDRSYDAVLCSHVLEHIANPLRALASWRRVTCPRGHLLMVVPHAAGTFDHRRPVTALSHMIEDFEREVGEDDLTHLEETLRLHDRQRGGEPGDQESWAARRRANAATRLLHHHTFTTPSLLALLDYAGLELIAVETRFPHDIYVLGRWPEEQRRPDNATFLATPRPSPFRVDGVKWRASSGA
jgi:SAM-dependent methyltransferase